MKVKDLIQESQVLRFGRNGHLGYIIFESLSGLGDDDQVKLANFIAPMFAENKLVCDYKKYKQHLETSFMRKLFGLTERNGTLLSITHPERLSGVQNNINTISYWRHSFMFASYLENAFIEFDRKFGLIILYECLGHRYGDLAVTKNKSNISMMKMFYKKSAELARLIKCPKQMFVLNFWEGCYYYKIDMYGDSVRSFQLFHSKFFDMKGKSRVFYGDKLQLSLQLLKECMSPDEYVKYCDNWLKKARGTRMAKIFSGVLK